MTNTEADDKKVVALAGLELLHHEYLSFLLANHSNGRSDVEQLFRKLENLGFTAGKCTAERMLMKATERPIEILDVLKWVCRHLWHEIFGKSADKLQTNNKDIFVFQDYKFRWVRFLSLPISDATSNEMSEDAKNLLKFIYYPCGIIRGALSVFGINCDVNADISGSPHCVFHVRVKPKGGL